MQNETIQHHHQKHTTISSRARPEFQHNTVSEQDMALINQLTHTPLRADQVYVRSMYLCSTQPCESDGCRFSRSALDEIAERIIGQSVLSGHNRQTLPIARFYKASVIEQGQDNQNHPIHFVRAWFYWLRETSGAKDLLLNIDGGIYREVSLSWRFNTWRCSICHTENGRCEHQVGVVYQGQTCYRLIEHIADVLEGSLVYKGADRNTYLARGELDCTDEMVYLITNSDDDLLQRLEHYGCLSDRHVLAELSTHFNESIECLWIRNISPDDHHQLSNRFLVEGGVSVGDLSLNKNAASLPQNQTLLVQKVDHVLEEIGHHDLGEVIHD